MTPTIVNPTLLAFGVTSLVLVLNLVFLWFFSGVTRARSATAINPEDAALQKAQLADTDPPMVARVLRAHANAEASIYPFLMLGLVYALLGGAYKTAVALFAVFTVARLLHSACYLGKAQPWRSIFFLVGTLATLVLMACLGWRIFQLA